VEEWTGRNETCRTGQAKAVEELAIRSTRYNRRKLPIDRLTVRGDRLKRSSTDAAHKRVFRL